MNWIQFLNDNLIEFASSGPRTTKGHIEIHCPFCGPDDESMHLGINISSGRWYCWRDKTHRGTKPEYLISRLLGVSGAQAKLLIEGYKGHTDDFDAPQAAINPLQPIAPVDWLNEFEPLTRKFTLYLEDRGFDNPNKLAAYYNLECCQVGRWKQRLIIPVLTHDRYIIGWQGRAIVNTKKAPRYLTSHQQVKRSIFNLQNISKGGEVLFVCEGPLDCLKLDWYGKPKFRATCLFGVTPTLEQIAQLSDLIPKFKKIYIIFDADTAGLSGGFNLSDWLPSIRFALPINTHDPGSMSKSDVRRYLDEYE